MEKTPVTKVWHSLASFGVPKYEISDLCEIRNISTGKFVKVHNMEKNKYVNIKFSLGNKELKPKNLLAHVIIATLFVTNPDPERYKTVDHKNQWKVIIDLII